MDTKNTSYTIDSPKTVAPSAPQQQIVEPSVEPPPSYTEFAPAQSPQLVFADAAQPQYVHQHMVHQPYMGAGGMVMVPPRLPLLPRELQPNDYLVVTLVVTIMCGFLNITSLFFSIPAIICSVMAYERRNTGSYDTAKHLGNVAIILNMLCVTWVMIWSVTTVGLLTACVYGVGDICF